jgi:hypothetical protein
LVAVSSFAFQLNARRAALMLRGRDQNLAAEMAALLFRRERVIEVDACRA